MNIASVRARISADDSDLQSGLKRADASIKGFVSRMNAVGSKLSLAVTAPLVGLAAASVRSATQMDSLKRGLTAVAGSAAEADRQLGRLREIAKLPGLGRVEAIAASTQLQAAGLSANMAERSLLAFGNALATVGKGKAELAGVTTALTQITAKGKVTAEEINQIAERVPQIRVAMQAAFGTANTEALQKMGLTARQFIEGINTELLKLPRVTGGVQNAFENLGDVVGEALGEIGRNILPTLLPMVEKATNALVSLTAQFAALSPEVRRNILAVTGLVALAGPTILFLGQFKGAATALGLSMPAVATAIRGVMALLTGPWGLAIAAAITAIGLLKTAWDQNLGGMRTTIEEWFGYVQPLMQVGWQAIVDGAQVWWTGLKEAWAALWQSMAESTGGFVNQIVQWLMKLPAALGINVEELLHRVELYRMGMSLMPTAEGGKPTPAAPSKTTPWKPTIVDDERKKALKAVREELSLNARLENLLRDQLGPAVEGLANAQLKNLEAHRQFPDVLRETIGQFSILGDEELKGLARSRLEIKILNEGLEARRALAKEVEAAQVKAREAAGTGGGLATRKQYAGWLLTNPDGTSEAEGLAGIIAGGERAGRLKELWKTVHDLRQESGRLGAAMQSDVGQGATAAGIAWDSLRLKMNDLSKEERAAVNRAFDYTQTIRIQTQEVERLRQETARWEQAHVDIDQSLRNGRTALDIFRDGTREAAFAWQEFGQSFRTLLPAAQDQIKELMRIDETLKTLQTVADGTKQIFFDAFSSIQDGFGGFFSTIYQGFKNLLVQMAAEYLSSQVARFFMNAVGGFLTGGAGSGWHAPMAIPGRQHGGPIHGNRPYLVGERGPEVIMPRRSGNVIPNHQLAGAGGANITVHMTVNTPDAGSFQRNRQAILGDLQSELQRAQRRNG